MFTHRYLGHEWFHRVLYEESKKTFKNSMMEQEQSNCEDFPSIDEDVYSHPNNTTTEDYFEDINTNNKRSIPHYTVYYNIKTGEVRQESPLPTLRALEPLEPSMVGRMEWRRRKLETLFCFRMMNVDLLRNKIQIYSGQRLRSQTFELDQSAGQQMFGQSRIEIERLLVGIFRDLFPVITDKKLDKFETEDCELSVNIKDADCLFIFSQTSCNEHDLLSSGNFMDKKDSHRLLEIRNFISKDRLHNNRVSRVSTDSLSLNSENTAQNKTYTIYLQKIVRGYLVRARKTRFRQHLKRKHQSIRSTFGLFSDGEDEDLSEIETEYSDKFETNEHHGRSQSAYNLRFSLTRHPSSTQNNYKKSQEEEISKPDSEPRLSSSDRAQLAQQVQREETFVQMQKCEDRVSLFMVSRQSDDCSDSDDDSDVLDSLSPNQSVMQHSNVLDFNLPDPPSFLPLDSANPCALSSSGEKITSGVSNNNFIEEKQSKKVSIVRELTIWSY